MVVKILVACYDFPQVQYLEMSRLGYSRGCVGITSFLKPKMLAIMLCYGGG